MGNSYVRSAKNWDQYESKNVQIAKELPVAKHVRLADDELREIEDQIFGIVDYKSWSDDNASEERKPKQQKIKVLLKKPLDLSNGPAGHERYFLLELGKSEQDIARELESLVPLLELELIQEQEFEFRKKQLLEALPDTSAIYQYYSNQEEADDADDSPTFIIVDGKQRGSNAVANVPTQKVKKNEIRLFLSSTFRDMQDERDALSKFTFPRIKQLCASKGLFFSEIDLRWGITEEQAKTGQILDICLSEIDRCRPYFVNLLGSRYGWVPTFYPDNLKAKFPFLAKITPGEKSVTELEVMHGALNNVKEAKNAHFFFRDPFAKETGAPSEYDDQPAKVDQLKKRIMDSGLPFYVYKSPKDMAEKLYIFLRDAINAEYPINNAPEDADSSAHEIFARSREKLYVGRSSDFEDLRNYVNNSSQTGLQITGQEGSGKSSLVANWVLQQFPSTFENQQRSPTVCIATFVGSSPASTDVIYVMRRIMLSMKKAFNLSDDVTKSTDFKQIERDFKRWLDIHVPAAQKLVIVIDGIDKLKDSEGTSALNFGWLPDRLSNRVKLIVTNSLSRSLTLTNRGWTLLSVHPMDVRSKETCTYEFLTTMYGKTLTPQQMKKITHLKQTNNPTYLRTLLEELRIHGVFEELEQKIDFYARARNPVELYERILCRLETDYNTVEYPTLVKDTLSLLWVSKQGLSDSEIINLLELPRLAFTSLFTAISSVLIVRSGLASFAHDHIRKAVERKYLVSEELKKKYYIMVADYFEDGPGSHDMPRKCEELPWCLSLSGQSFRLAKCLSDLDVFYLLFTKQNKFEFKRYWLKIVKDYDIAAVYLESLQGSKSVHDDDKLCKITIRVAKFMKEMLQYQAAEQLYLEAVTLSESLYGTECEETAKIRYLLAQLFWNQGRFDEAEPHCQISLKVRERVLGPDHTKVAKSLCGLGEMDIERNPAKAKPLLERALSIYEAKLGRDHHFVARILHDLATVYDSFKQHQEAIKLHLEGIKITEKALGAGHVQLAVAYEVLGITYKLAKELQKAAKSFQKALSINEDVHGNIHPSTASCLEWLVMVYNELNLVFKADEFQTRLHIVQAELDRLGIKVGERIVDY